MKVLLFLSMLTAFECFARPRDAEVEIIAAGKSGKLSKVVAEIKSRRIKRTVTDDSVQVTDKDCRFNITGKPTSAHNGDCKHDIDEETQEIVIKCVSDNLFPDGPRRFSIGPGNCTTDVLKMEIGKSRCVFTSHQPAPFHQFKGKCREGFNNHCVVPANSRDPMVIGASGDCTPGRNVMVEKDQQEAEKNNMKTEENYEKKSSKVKA